MARITVVVIGRAAFLHIRASAVCAAVPRALQAENSRADQGTAGRGLRQHLAPPGSGAGCGARRTHGSELRLRNSRKAHTARGLRRRWRGARPLRAGNTEQALGSLGRTPPLAKLPRRPSVAGARTHTQRAPGRRGCDAAGGEGDRTMASSRVQEEARDDLCSAIASRGAVTLPHPHMYGTLTARLLSASCTASTGNQ